MRLGDVCESIVDCAHKTAPIDANGEYFAVGTPAMRGHRIDLDEARRINRGTFEKWTERLRPRAGDLLIAREAPVGPVVMIPDEENVAPGQRTVLLRPNPNSVDSRFLYYFLASPRLQSELQVKAAGSTVPHLNVADLRDLAVPGLPGLPEQRSIAQVLGALDDKIAANDRLIALVDDLLAARFAFLSVGKDSTSLSSIARVNVANTRPVPGGSLRYLDISSVRKGEYDYPEETSWDCAPGRARRVVRRFDTVWSTVRPNRRSHALVLDDDPLMVASTGLAVLTPNVGRCAGLYEAAKRPEFESFLLSVAEGSAYPAVRADRFADAPVPNLSDAEWDEFEVVALPSRERAHAAAVESRRLAAARNELLPLLMSGKVNVNDVEGSA